MITSRKEFKECLAADNPWLRPHGIKQRAVERIAAYPHSQLRRYLRYLRLQEYCKNTGRGIRAIWYEGMKNRLGSRLGLEIGPNCFGKGLNLYHGGCVINPNVRAGENCSLHGANCIGNNGLTQDAPVLGNGVDVGYGAVVIGGITIADGVKIGANAVVNRSVTEPGCTVAGVPARIVRHGGQDNA